MADAISDTSGPKPLRKRGARFVMFMGPVLDALRELGASARPSEVYDVVAKNLKISDAELEETNKNGGSKFENRVAWARFYLSRAGLIDPEQRGIWVLTERGRETRLTNDEAQVLWKNIVAQFRAEREKRLSSDKGQEAFADTEEEADEHFPPENEGYINRSEISERLADILRNLSAAGFEEFCVLVLRRIGFENVQRTGGRGDRGVDGEGHLMLNRFVRTKIMFQCKRYQDKIGPDRIRDFRGAIQGGADRGIFLTTGTFTRDAKIEASRENATPIELVDIDSLIEIMIEEKLGVEERKALQLSDQFFEVYR